ncbi:hypothetical protein QA584_10905 [Anaerocolumna sp. AGMB13025]|uniref:hypothetical protein n=1 Tax=Anaerocolumna sp. AGMB13025 TaxID=3039116 RepID=UPI00241CB57B|nr:hypothetical protein [Anaerocolumna sp. AGMB13025]WFR59572.1 hypothetical protein QA584_10905 [Anaerocolumna sp. AGMB13025]
MIKRYSYMGVIILCCILVVACDKQKQTEKKSDTGLQAKNVVSITPITGGMQKIEEADFNTDMMNWLMETTDIPVYLPCNWAPIINKDGIQKYYLEASGNEDSYNINVYATKVSVKFNDNSDLLNKNGPVSEVDFVGAISGGKSKITADSAKKPEDAKHFELTPGITAYEDGTSVWWKEGGWTFEYIGSSDINSLEMIASAWSDFDTQASKTVNVKIVGGNRLTFDYTWVNDGYQYSFTTHETDYDDVFKILNSFISIETKNFKVLSQF